VAGFTLPPDASTFPYDMGTGNWTPLISNYSNTKLSYPDADKLLAIGGVAESVTKCDSGAYVAGIFVKGLLRALLWYTDSRKDADPPSASECQTKSYRGPSWSWISSDLPIMYNAAGINSKESLRSLATFKPYSVEPHNNKSDPFGQVKCASITLQGLLVDGTANILNAEEWNALHANSTGPQFSMFAGSVTSVFMKFRSWSPLHHDKLEWTFVFVDLQVGKIPKTVGKILAAMEIFCY
jgi:hypothetical protein